MLMHAGSPFSEWGHLHVSEARAVSWLSTSVLEFCAPLWSAAIQVVEEFLTIMAVVGMIARRVGEMCSYPSASYHFASVAMRLLT